MISSWYTDGEMDSMVWTDNLNFALKMTVDGISQWNFILVSLFKPPQKKTRFVIVYLFLFSEWVLRFFNCKKLSPILDSQLWPVKYTSDLKNTQTGSCLFLLWIVDRSKKRHVSPVSATFNSKSFIEQLWPEFSIPMQGF